MQTTKGKKSWARILIVDDHPMVRAGLMRLIEQQPDMQCCGEAATAAEARSTALKLQPDVTIVDLRLKSGDGLELIKDLVTEVRAMKILVLSQHNEQVYVERALRAGALGFVAKDQPPEDVLQAIRSILMGDLYLSNAIAKRVLQQFATGHFETGRPGVERLSDRELVVLRLLGEGRSTRETADELNISFKTVESHRENIKRKLGLEHAAELMNYAARWVNQSTQPQSLDAEIKPSPSSAPPTRSGSS